MKSSEMYKERIIENYKDPNNLGELKSPTHEKRLFNQSCGDEIKIQLIVDKNKIKDIKFSGKSCAICTASASLITEVIKNKDINEVEKFKKEKVIEILGIEVIPTRIKCALLPLEAIKEAIKNEIA